jgi:hypothetical protein
MHQGQQEMQAAWDELYGHVAEGIGAYGVEHMETLLPVAPWVGW